MPITAVSAAEPPSRHNIVEAVAAHTRLRLFGPNGRLFAGTCPFCDSPAFRVRPHHGTFHCFGCGEAGDADMFVTKIDRRNPSSGQ